MTSAEFIHRLRSAYATLSVYADCGMASSSAGRLRVNFQTSFVRGHRFRFEYVQKANRTAIWSDGIHTYTYSLSGPRASFDIIDDGPDLGSAIAAVAGVSSGTSDIVPAMLLPLSVGRFCSRLADLNDLSLDGDEYVGPNSCARINGRIPNQGLATLWVDRNTYLLRRVVTLRGSVHETTTSYEPSLDPIDIRSIEYPDVEKTAPRARVTPWTGIGLAAGSRRVESIGPGSPAERSGLTIGDEVEVVNGQRTEGFFDVLRALHVVDIGGHIALTIRRGGTTREAVVVVEAVPQSERTVPSKPLME
jgi:hypothetical protein